MGRAVGLGALRWLSTLAAACVFVLAAPASAFALGDLTPPDSTAAPPAFSNTATFQIPYVASDDPGGSGVAHVDLYARAPGEFLYTDVASVTPDTPAFTYTATGGDGDYSFYSVATDNDGNTELAPLLGSDGTTTVDTTAPSSSAGTATDAGGEMVAVPYTASDAGSGIASVELWVQRPGDSAFALADTSSAGSGTFNYATGGPGDYGFYTVAVDNAGNREPAPGSADTTFTVPQPPPPDVTAPGSNASPPAYSTSTTFDIPYTAADDAGGSGVSHVDLYARAPGESGYTDVGSLAPGTPAFTYTATAGDGDYSFYTVATDNAGNTELSPAAGPDGTTTVDTSAPASSAGPASSGSGGHVTVPYSASDSGSGIASVELWAKKPADGSYSLADTSNADSGAFSYATSGPGDYDFYTVAVDKAGNRESAPAAADTTFNVPQPPPPDVTAPHSSASPPTYSKSTTWDIPYSAADDTGGSGVAHVDLYARAPGDSVFTKVASATAATGAFTYAAGAGDGAYSFYTVATDNAGNGELAPLSGSDGTTTLDTVAPSSSATGATAGANGNVTVPFTATDSRSGIASVELWVKKPGDSSFSRADTSSNGTGSFSYATSGPGDYDFYTVAVDNAGNREPAPGAADATFSVAQPSSGDTTPAATPPPSAPNPVVELPASSPSTPVTTPAAGTVPQIPIVAALTLPRGQTLRSLRIRGLIVELYAYRAVTLRVALLANNATSARRLGLGRKRVVAQRTFSATDPKIYPVTLMPGRQVRQRLRRLRSATLLLRTTLQSASGSSTATNPVRLRAR